VQHFWSLAVEEQYYLVWPVLVLAAAMLARRLRVRPRTVLWFALAAVAVPSLLWSLRATAHSPAEAFFSTGTRMWELALGAGIALASGLLARLPGLVAAGMGWVGLGTIVASGLIFSTGTPWPGYLAALPTVGAAAVIAGGFAGGRGGPVAVLGIRPMRWVGRLSYSLYLWHWPLLVLATEIRGHLGPRAGAAVVAASFLPAWLSYKLVENPVRRSPAVNRSPRLALSLGTTFTALGAVCGLLLMFMSMRAAAPGVPPGAALGAGVLPSSQGPSGAPTVLIPDRADYITPDPLVATEDVPALYGQGCQQNQTDDELISCVYGDPTSATTVVLAGDSKAAQWAPALEILAAENGWRLVTYTKSSCTLGTAVQLLNGEPYHSCTRWNQSLLDRLIQERPAYVITSGAARTAQDPTGEPTIAAMADGLRGAWSTLAAGGMPVIVIADNAAPGFPVYECVDEHRDSLSACAFDPARRETTGGYRTQILAVQGLAGVAMVDLWDAICPAPRCPPVIGNVLVYRQGSHLTATYVRTLTPRLATALTGVGLPAHVAP
jgi:hypothetical protein